MTNPSNPDSKRIIVVPPLSDETKRRATRHIASMARDADDCALLLDALGLNANDGKAT